MLTDFVTLNLTSGSVLFSKYLKKLLKPIALAVVLAFASCVPTNNAPIESNLIPSSTAAKVENFKDTDPVSLPVVGDSPLSELGSDEITISWVKPETKVDGYILKYGFAQDQITQSKSIKLTDLKEIESNDHGLLYEYILSGIDPAKVLYFTLQSTLGKDISQPTPIRIVAPVGGGAAQLD